MKGVNMADFRVSLEELLAWCRKTDVTGISRRMLFFESEESGWLHYVPRLLVLLAGQSRITYRETLGYIVSCFISYLQY